MTVEDHSPLVAVDVGNSRIKLGLFDAAPKGSDLPEPGRTLLVGTHEWDPAQIAPWLAPFAPADFPWYVASVHRAAADRLAGWLASEAPATNVHQLAYDELALTIDLERPEAVGIDRLLGAVAANHLRPLHHPAIVIDLGTAITVDAISQRGTFRGGAILPGIEISARALHEFTDLLPDLGVSMLQDPPPALGTSTEAAIASGLFWGPIGAIRTLIEQLSQDMENQPLVLLTGGTAHSVTELLPLAARYEPHLVLAGIALCVTEL